MYRIAWVFLCAFASVCTFSYSNLRPCKPDDDACIRDILNYFIQAAITGDASRNIISLDPMSQEYVQGKFAIINYTLHNSTVRGFQKCRAVQTKLNLEKNTLFVRMFCPDLHMFGSYQASGMLISAPIQGNGDYSFKCKEYHIRIPNDIKIIQAKDGNRYVQIRNFELTADLKGGLIVDLTNLFNGENKELADAALKFANEYWKPLSQELQGPIITANVKKVIKNLNKYLKMAPLDSLLIKS